MRTLSTATLLLLLGLASNIETKVYQLELKTGLDFVGSGQGNITIVPPNFIGGMTIGTPYVNNTVIFLSTTPNLVVAPESPDYVPGNSTTFVSAGTNSSMVINGQSFLTFNYTGPLAYETFGFGGLTAVGQKFLICSDPFNPYPTFAGFGFNRPGDFGAPNFVETLYEQGQLSSNVISFAFARGGTVPNTAYIGGVNSSRIGAPLMEYPVSINNGNWAYHLTNVQAGSSFFGYNGVVTVDTESSWSLVSLPVLQLISGTLTGSYDGSAFSQSSSTYFLEFDCTNYLNSTKVYPNITFYLDQQPFIFTPRQYLLPFNSSFCMLMFVAPLPGVAAYPSPYTIGTFGFNSTYSIFNMTSRAMGVAPLLM